MNHRLEQELPNWTCSIYKEGLQLRRTERKRGKFLYQVWPRVGDALLHGFDLSLEIVVIELLEIFDVGERKLLLLTAVRNFLQLEPGPLSLPVIRALRVLLDGLVELRSSLIKKHLL